MIRSRREISYGTADKTHLTLSRGGHSKLFSLVQPTYPGTNRMPIDPIPKQKSLLRNPLLYTSAVVVVALLGVVFVMVSRWQERRSIDRQTEKQRAEKQREEDRVAVEQLGGKDFTILSFYASPTVIRRGESAQLCYGVSNAKSVTLEPQTQPVWPSPAHCVDVSPTKSMTYTLTIVNAAGASKSQTVEVKVR